MNILLLIHIVIAVLLITIILLQQTGMDGLSGIGGSSGNMNVVTARTAANFLTKTTIFLAILFLINSLVLANMSARMQPNINKKIEEFQEEKEQNMVPVAR